MSGMPGRANGVEVGATTRMSESSGSGHGIVGEEPAAKRSRNSATMGPLPLNFTMTANEIEATCKEIEDTLNSDIQQMLEGGLHVAITFSQLIARRVIDRHTALN